MVDLVKGTGFPPEANVGRGLRWRQVALSLLLCFTFRTWIENEPSRKVQVSKKGHTPSELPLPHVAINPRLFPASSSGLLIFSLLILFCELGD